MQCNLHSLVCIVIEMEKLADYQLVYQKIPVFPSDVDPW